MVSTRSSSKQRQQTIKAAHSAHTEPKKTKNAATYKSQKTPSPAGKPPPGGFRDDVLRTMNRLLGKLSSAESTICPSQIPRALNKDSPSRYADWRALMQPIREVVWQQVEAGRVQVTQGGEVRPYEDRETLKGPIRVRKGPKWDSG